MGRSIEMGNLMFLAGITALLIGIFIFLFVFRTIKPLIRTKRGKDTYENWLMRYGTMTKVMAAALSVFGITCIVQNNPDLQQSPEELSSVQEWSNSDKERLTRDCIEMYTSNQEIPKQDVDLAENYCSCTTEKMTEQFTITDLIAHDTLNRTEKMDLYEPVVSSCIRDLEYNLRERYQTP